jgi:O-antigen/teichoic acid export membrane protein
MTDRIKYETPRSTTSRNISWNYLGHIFKLAANLGLTFLIVRRLSVAEYGIFLFAIVLSSSIYMLDLGISTVLIQRFTAASLSPEEKHLDELIGTVIAALAALGAVGASLLIGLSLLLPGPFKIPPQYVHEASLVFVATAGSVFFGFLNLGFEPMYQAANRFDRLNQIQLAGSGFAFLCSATLLYFGYGIVALAAVQCLATAIQFLLFVVFFSSLSPYARIHLRDFRWNILADILNLGKWPFLDNVSSYISEALLWIILGSLTSMNEAAFFGLASKLPNHLWFLIDRGAGVSLPLMAQEMERHDQENLRRIYLVTQKLVLGLVLPFVVLGSVFARPLIHIWVGDTFAPSAVVMRWLLLASLAHAILYSSDLLLWSAGRYRRIALFSASGSMMTLALALVLVPRYGAAGVAISTAVVQALFVCTPTTLQACKLAHISLRCLATETTDGIKLPVAIMVLGIAMALVLGRNASPAWLVVAGILIGISYFVTLAVRTGLPLFRRDLGESKNI